MNSAPAPLYRVERLADHQTQASFVSGNLDLDSYLHLHAGQDLKRKVAVPFLMLDQMGPVEYLPGQAGDQPRLSGEKARPALIDGCAAKELEEYGGGRFDRSSRRRLRREGAFILSAS